MPVGSTAEPKLFVGQLPSACTEEEIVAKFKECGEIKSCKILRYLDGHTKGCAMVAFQTFAEAEKAISQFHGKPFAEGERPMVVNFATPKSQGGGVSGGSAPAAVEEKSVFVGKLPKAVTQEEIRDAFSPHGEVAEVYIPKRDGQGQGIAFVRFGSWAAAEAAIKNMNGKHACGSEEPIVVRFADAKKRDHRSSLGGGEAYARPLKRHMGNEYEWMSQGPLPPRGFGGFNPGMPGAMMVGGPKGLYNPPLMGFNHSVVPGWGNAGYGWNPMATPRSGYGGGPPMPPHLHPLAAAQDMHGSLGVHPIHTHGQLGNAGGVAAGVAQAIASTHSMQGVGQMGGIAVGGMGMSAMGMGTPHMPPVGATVVGMAPSMGMNGGGKTEHKPWKLFVGQVPSTATEADLQPIMALYGYIQDVYVLRDHQGRSKGCAFVTFENAESAQAAIAGVNEKVIMPGGMPGKPLRVRYANPPRQAR